jgi:hypothetical protein
MGPLPPAVAIPTLSQTGNWQFLSPSMPQPARQPKPPPASQALQLVVPTVRTWEPVSRDWEEPDVSWQLYITLGQWDVDIIRKLPQHQKMLYGNHKLIANMYINVRVNCSTWLPSLRSDCIFFRYNRDRVQFLAKFPMATKSVNALLEAVRVET